MKNTRLLIPIVFLFGAIYFPSCSETEATASIPELLRQLEESTDEEEKARVKVLLERECEKIDNADYGSFTDPRDGKTYRTILMRDGRIWMAENMNYELEGSVCYQKDPTYCKEFGRIYTWDNISEACPEGWHVPHESEWWNMIRLYGNISSGYFDFSSDGEAAYAHLIKGGITKFNIVIGGWYLEDHQEFGALRKQSDYWTNLEESQGDRYYYFKFSSVTESVSRHKGGAWWGIEKEEFSGYCRCIQDQD